MRHFLQWLLLALPLCIISPAKAQVAFPKSGCEFQVFFLDEPKVSSASVKDGAGNLVKSDIADWSVAIKGVTHYFRAECAHVPGARKVYSRDEDIIDDMNALAAAQSLQSPKVFVKTIDGVGKVGEISGVMVARGISLRIDVRRYFGDAAIFDLYAASDPSAFPTENVSMFMRSISRNGKFYDPEFQKRFGK